MSGMISDQSPDSPFIQIIVIVYTKKVINMYLWIQIFLARRDILITERKKKCILKEGVPGYELYRMER